MAAATGRTNGTTNTTTASTLVSVGPSGSDPTAVDPPADVMMPPSPAATQLSPPMVPTSLSPVVQSRDSHTRTTPTTQPRNGITSRTRAAISRRGVAGRVGRRRDAGALAGLGGDVGRVAEAFQQGADAGLGLGIELGPGGGDVLADLVQELLAAVGGQVVELGLQLLEVAEDQGVGFGGHGLPPCRSRRSTASVKRSHSVVNRASACWPWAVSW